MQTYSGIILNIYVAINHQSYYKYGWWVITLSETKQFSITLKYKLTCFAWTCSEHTKYIDFS